VGLPFTSAPIAFFLARERGLEFATTAAWGIMAGTLSQAAFAVAYAWLARRTRWPLATLAGCAAFALATAALASATTPASVLGIVAAAALVTALWLMPPAREAQSAPRSPRWDLPARMAVATAFVLVVTALAGVLGPRLAGLLAPFPLYAAVLSAFAHALAGASAAAGVLRGLLLGLFAFTAFFFVLASTLTRAGLGPAFALALAVALAVQGTSLWALRRGR
jgi:hypothetical protein